MFKIFLALLFSVTAFAGPEHGMPVSIFGYNPCMNPGSTLVSTSNATSGNSAVEIVPLVSGQKIYICSLSVTGVSGTTPTFSLVQGTGSNCGSSQTVVLHAFTSTAGALFAFANPVAAGIVSEALCYLDTGTTPIQNYQMTYVQQ